jgi:hypothetical protein
MHCVLVGVMIIFGITLIRLVVYRVGPTGLVEENAGAVRWRADAHPGAVLVVERAAAAEGLDLVQLGPFGVSRINPYPRDCGKDTV